MKLKNSRFLTVRMIGKTYESLQVAAEKEMMTISSFARKILTKWLEANNGR